MIISDDRYFWRTYADKMAERDIERWVDSWESMLCCICGDEIILEKAKAKSCAQCCAWVCQICEADNMRTNHDSPILKCPLCRQPFYEVQISIARNPNLS